MAFELFELTGKRALVTGSSQGIGFALAQGLAEHGAEVVLNGRDPGIRPQWHQFVAYASAWERVPDDGLPRHHERRG